VLDGELAALDAEGRPDFNLLQNYRSAAARLMYFVFDILIHKGRSLLVLPLSERRQILRKVVKANDHVQIVKVSTNADSIIRFVKEHHLEGVIAKRADSHYLPGKRLSSCVKIRITTSQEFRTQS